MKIIIKSILYFLIIFICIDSYGSEYNNVGKISFQQKKDSTTKFFVFPQLGYVWQGTNNFESGIKATYFINHKKDQRNISVVAGGNLFKHNVTYFSPFITLRYHQGYTQKFPLIISSSYSYTKANNIIDNRITPEIGFSFIFFSFTYGYNIPLQKDKLSFITPHRLALRISLY